MTTTTTTTRTERLRHAHPHAFGRGCAGHEDGRTGELVPFARRRRGRFPQPRARSRNAGVRVKLRDGDEKRVTPTKGFLADAERSMFLLSPDAGRREKLYQMDLERECVIAAWGCQKDGVDVPMSDADRGGYQVVARRKPDGARSSAWTITGSCGGTRASRAGWRRRSRAPRWGTGTVTTSRARTKFRCMATAGDGCIAVGSRMARFDARTATRACARPRRASRAGKPHHAHRRDVRRQVDSRDDVDVPRAAAHRDQGFQNWGSHERVQDERAAQRCNRLLKLKPEDAARARRRALTRGKFTWSRSRGSRSGGSWPRARTLHPVQLPQSQDSHARRTRGWMEFTDYNVVGKDSAIAESTFVHEKFTARHALSHRHHERRRVLRGRVGRVTKRNAAAARDGDDGRRARRETPIFFPFLQISTNSRRAFHVSATSAPPASRWARRLATPHDDAADVFKAPGVDSGPLDSVERREDPAIGVAVASRLKLRAVAAAKEARGVRFRYNGGVIDGTDAGVVELAISRVKIDDTRAVTAALDANEPLLVTLFHRRGEDRRRVRRGWRRRRRAERSRK